MSEISLLPTMIHPGLLWLAYNRGWMGEVKGGEEMHMRHQRHMRHDRSVKYAAHAAYPAKSADAKTTSQSNSVPYPSSYLS